MTTALEGGKWSAARPGRTLPPGKTRYPLYRWLAGPQGRSGRAENLVRTGIRSRTVQPVVSRYIDWPTRPISCSVPCYFIRIQIYCHYYSVDYVLMVKLTRNFVFGSVTTFVGTETSWAEQQPWTDQIKFIASVSNISGRKETLSKLCSVAEI